MTYLIHLHFKTILALLCLTIGSLVVGNVAVSATLSSSGEHIRQLESEKQTLTEQNQDLRRFILAKQALVNLESKAESLGFVPPVQVLSIAPNTSVALNQN